jgi:protease II
MKTITREEFDNLKYGDILYCEDKDYKVNHVVNDIVFTINQISNEANLYSFNELKQDRFYLKQETQYYCGFEVGDYSDKNVWVKVSEVSLEEAENKKVAYKLVLVKPTFIFTGGISWKYAVKLEM